MKRCVFCEISYKEILIENELAVAFYDKFPVNHGHVLIIPKRHVETLFDASFEELQDINKLIFEVKNFLEDKYKPDGYNIGINVGEAAGQTIFHLHYHIMPRYVGDVEDPRGGIRNIKKSLVQYLDDGEE
ncbi:MAG: HIT family hydrolase [Desulfitibacter sp. BRH_c19]|nr:MAG: HIT family hydrolase [Desulfitibacter sp. BRH_c19]